jgi:hypothetical protein
MSSKEERGIFLRTGDVPEGCDRFGYSHPTYGDEPEDDDGGMSDKDGPFDPSKTCPTPPPPPSQLRPPLPTPPPPPVLTPEQIEMKWLPPPPTHVPVPQLRDIGMASGGKREPPYLQQIDEIRQQGLETRAKSAKPTPSRAPLQADDLSVSVRGSACPSLPPAPPPPHCVGVDQQGGGRDPSSAPPPDADAGRGSFAPPLAPSAGWDFSASGRHPSSAPGIPQSWGSAGFGPMSGQNLPAHHRTGPYSTPTHFGGASSSNSTLLLPPPPPPPAAVPIEGGPVIPLPYKLDIGWARDQVVCVHRQGRRPAIQGRYPMAIETDQELSDPSRRLKIVDITDLVSSPDRSEMSSKLAMKIYGLLTFDVTNSHILMDSGGWIKLAPICESLNLRYDEFLKIASSLPFDGLEISVFSTGDHGDVTQDRPHGVRAKYGHFLGLD